MYNNFKNYLNPYDAMYFPFTTNLVVINQMYLKLKSVDQIGVDSHIKKIEKLAFYFRDKIKLLPVKLAADSPSVCCSVLYTDKTDIITFFNEMVEKNIYFTPTGGKNGKIFSVGHLGDLNKKDYGVFIRELEKWLHIQ
jgi:aspartate aminotransferase-like enzyme